eukprot:TRINITY_DN1073_c1_g1_i1.p1 TRINITY_DN1073_c1_g1~~TRINITY_DN1073_c1_g1_i1.p1  ORF type:complete len:231 (+),score=85.58 TRINITY_DN1073_c1_g1_i1:54-746(+)
MPSGSALCPHFVRGIIALMESYSRGVPRGENPFEGKAWISIEAYMRRVFKYCALEEEDIVIGLMLLDRLSFMHPECRPSETSFHRMFLISLVVAVKYRSDFYYTNTYYASVGGIDVKQFNKLERVFLQMIDFDVAVLPEEYSEFYAIVDKQFGLSGPAPVLALVDFEQHQSLYQHSYQYDYTEDALSQYSATSYDTSSSYHYQHTQPTLYTHTYTPCNIWYPSSVGASCY